MVPYHERLAVYVSKGVVLIGTRRPLELHVADVIACFDDDPSMQVDLETTPGLA
jgi:hypothetical protein